MTELAPIAATNPWLHPLAPTNPPSASERLIRALEAHASAEAHDLAVCEELAARSADPVLKTLMGLVVDDEQRHHSLLQSMVHRLQEEVEFVASPTALPVSDHEVTAEPELAANLRALIRDEHEGARHLRHLARQEPHLYDGLYPRPPKRVGRKTTPSGVVERHELAHARQHVSHVDRSARRLRRG